LDTQLLRAVVVVVVQVLPFMRGAAVVVRVLCDTQRQQLVLVLYL
jgi:hypothetical protein